ncbi:MAG: hypothetical protein ABIP03_04675 [Aquihabitans sp.]
MLKRVTLAIGLAAATLSECVSPDGPSPTSAPGCQTTGDLRLVYTGAAGDGGGDLFGLTVDGHVRKLTTDGGSFDPAFSPDGSRIVFSSIGENGSANGQTGVSGLDLHVMAADGSGRRRLLDGDEDGMPAWSPDAATSSQQQIYPDATDTPPATVHGVPGTSKLMASRLALRPTPCDRRGFVVPTLGPNHAEIPTSGKSRHRQPVTEAIHGLPAPPTRDRRRPVPDWCTPIESAGRLEPWMPTTRRHLALRTMTSGPSNSPGLSRSFRQAASAP